KGIFNLLRIVLGFGLFSPVSFLGKSQSLIGVNMLKIGDHRKDVLEAGFRGVEKLYEDGILQPHVDKVFQADELAQAHDYVEGRHSIGKVVVMF
ncbi:MAG TPA: zinc-binding dehydrogenase, partial [Saprospiraceae bacterium]|nr:zinc-binding dehydrogenase [Saprospiraceae bacterium]